MATHSSVLAWRIPGTGEPGGLPSMGSHSQTRLNSLSSSSSSRERAITTHRQDIGSTSQLLSLKGVLYPIFDVCSLSHFLQDLSPALVRQELDLEHETEFS